MLFSDTLTLDAPKRTADGYLAVRARAARTGVYDYLASEPSIADALPEGHNFKPNDIVKVLRDENTVFDKKSAHSFIGKPITDDHPAEAVNSANWRDHARGTVLNALRDGEFLAFDLLLTDAATIAKVDAGKAELSNGYGATLEFGDFTAPDGTKCHARQTAITGNHVAIVDRGRAGSGCRIGDAAPCEPAPQSFLDSLTKEKPVKTMLIDGLTVDVSNPDTAVATIQTLITARDAAAAKVTDAEAKVVAHEATIVAKDAEITKLTADLAAAKPSLQQLRDAGKAFAVIEAKAKAAGVTVTDAMDETAIMRAVVDKAMGDKAKDYSAEHVAIAFDALTKDLKLDAAAPTLDAFKGGLQSVSDAAGEYADFRAKRKTSISDAWRQPFAGNPADMN